MQLPSRLMPRKGRQTDLDRRKAEQDRTFDEIDRMLADKAAKEQAIVIDNMQED